MITDPSAIAFSNEDVRPMADALAQCYFQALTLVNNWNALNMGSLITDTPDVVQDGSPADGRTAITGAMANNVIAVAQGVVTSYQANTNQVLTQLLQVSVNP